VWVGVVADQSGAQAGFAEAQLTACTYSLASGGLRRRAPASMFLSSPSPSSLSSPARSRTWTTMGCTAGRAAARPIHSTLPVCSPLRSQRCPGKVSCLTVARSWTWAHCCSGAPLAFICWQSFAEPSAPPEANEISSVTESAILVGGVCGAKGLRNVVPNVAGRFFGSSLPPSVLQHVLLSRAQTAACMRVGPMHCSRELRPRTHVPLTG
jgi:hypothetical protein